MDIPSIVLVLTNGLLLLSCHTHGFDDRCDIGYKWCSDDSQCVQYHHKCRTEDCIIPSWMTECDNQIECYTNTHKCDGIKHCDDGSDEKNCPLRATCDYDELKCNDGELCYKTYEKCDGRSHCNDHSDELNCYDDTGESYSSEEEAEYHSGSSNRSTILYMLLLLPVVVVILGVCCYYCCCRKTGRAATPAGQPTVTGSYTGPVATAGAVPAGVQQPCHHHHNQYTAQYHQPLLGPGRLDVSGSSSMPSIPSAPVDPASAPPPSYDEVVGSNKYRRTSSLDRLPPSEFSGAATAPIEPSAPSAYR